MSSISRTVDIRSLETTGNEDSLLLVIMSGHSIMPGTRIPPSYSEPFHPHKPFVTPGVLHFDPLSLENHKKVVFDA